MESSDSPRGEIFGLSKKPFKNMTIKNNKELLEDISLLKKEISHLKKRKKYGLVWEDKPEIFDPAAMQHIIALFAAQKVIIGAGVDSGCCVAHRATIVYGDIGIE